MSIKTYEISESVIARTLHALSTSSASNEGDRLNHHQAIIGLKMEIESQKEEAKAVVV